ncbi:MAG: HAD-IB family hydrolase [Spirochaetes bacterium]|nr:HAD-IB family hydrolase [Spirochaetota bacterium]
MDTSRFAFFDVDHTLTRHSTGRRFVFLGVQKGVFPISALLTMPFYYTCYRLGFMPIRKLDRSFPFLRGKTREELEELAAKTFDQWIKKDIYPEAAQLIQSLQARGTRVILATSSLDMLVRPLAQYLGVPEYISSSLEFLNHRSTGNLIGFPAFGDEKKRFVLEFLEQNGGTAEECSFYSDSITDLPLLEEVAHPMAVNPDPRLYFVAKRKGWPILRFH